MPKSKNYITPLQAINLLNAFEFARLIDCPLNTHVTIRWSYTGDADRRKQVRDFTNRLYHWLLNNEIPPAFVYVNEVGEDCGLHTHILVHIPTEKKLSFRQICGKWNKKVHPRFIFVTKLNHGISYLLKGIDPSAIVIYENQNVILTENLTERFYGYHCDPQGTIEFKRVGMSRSIDKLARSKADFIPAYSK